MHEKNTINRPAVPNYHYKISEIRKGAPKKRCVCIVQSNKTATHLISQQEIVNGMKRVYSTHIFQFLQFSLHLLKLTHHHTH